MIYPHLVPGDQRLCVHWRSMQMQIEAGKVSMLFYTSLMIASLFAALVLLWAFHLIRNASQAVLKSMTPDSIKGPTGHLGTVGKSKRKSGPIAPWGWKNHNTPQNMAKTHAAKPLMRDNPYAVKKTDSSHLPQAGWVHREDKSELGGNSYKVSRKVNDMAAGFKTADRPWGW